MKLAAWHQTRFSYSEPVTCEPLLVRLRPRDDPAQRLLSYCLHVTPEPAHIDQQLDLDGNVASVLYIARPLDALSIAAQWEVETLRTNPFDFLLRPGSERLPLSPSDGERPCWEFYATPGTVDADVARLVAEIRMAARDDTVDFVCRLARTIGHRHEKIVRHEGPPWSPGQTLTRREGSCRDLALLFIEGCRQVGIPARFTSGYALADDADAPQHLHAWAEVYLPGAGWRGFDPSSGLAVGERHVAVAAARDPAGATATEGTFRSDTARSEMLVEVELRASAACEI